MITVNIDKAKEIAHDMRRAKRDAEFAPLDKLATVPSLAEQAEIDREAVRVKYAAIQVEIDKAKTVEKLKAVLP